MAAYQELHRLGQLHRRVEGAWAILEDCHLCPRECRVNRLAGEVGECRTGRRAVVSSYGPHFGEEAPLVGSRGSGTIFFTHCNLRCLFCQNFTISQRGEGEEVDSQQLSAMMLALQARGCHNLNLVTPTHVVPHILSALELAVERGLSLPLVYNCGGYEAVETLRLLGGIVDIYMPDMKYSDPDTARRLSGIEDYPAFNRAAVREMHRQVGDLQVDEQGVARRGLLVRHLVLPHGQAGTEGVVSFLAREVSPWTYLNLMAQYRPCYRAFDIPELARPLLPEEYRPALEMARRYGLHRLDRMESRLPALFG